MRQLLRIENKTDCLIMIFCSMHYRLYSKLQVRKCQTFWGRLFFCEWTYVRNMTSGRSGREHFASANRQGDRAQAAKGHGACGVPDFASKGFVFRDGSCLDCVERLPLEAEPFRQLVEVVERIAQGTDHIRIDVFFRGGVKVKGKRGVQVARSMSTRPTSALWLEFQWPKGAVVESSQGILIW